jgi:hypothetical protein
MGVGLVLGMVNLVAALSAGFLPETTGKGLDNDLNNNPEEEEEDREEQERDEKLSPIDRSGPVSSSSIGHSHSLSLPHHRSPAYQMVKKKDLDNHNNNPNHHNPSRQKHGYSSFRIKEEEDDDDDEEQFHQQEEGEDGEELELDDSPVIKNPMIR